MRVFLIVVALASLAALPACRDGSGALPADGSQPSARFTGAMLAAAFDAPLDVVARTAASQAPGIAGSLVSAGFAPVDPVASALDRFASPPLPQCLVAGFTGWDSDDLGVDTNESGGHRAEFNMASGTWDLIESTARSHDGDLAIWRYYEWDGAALDQVAAAAAAGRPVVLLGHSAGGAAAIALAWELEARGLPVALLLELDTYTGGSWLLRAPPWVLSDGRDVPVNVVEVVNVYQRQWWMYKGRAHTFAPGKGTNIELKTGHAGIDSAAAEIPVVRDAVERACGGRQPATPSMLTATERYHDGGHLDVKLTWADTARTETGFLLYAAQCTPGGDCGEYTRIARAEPGTTRFDLEFPAGAAETVGYERCYAVAAYNSNGESTLSPAISPATGHTCP